MKPSDFRELVNKPGTSIGLIGEYSGDSDWSQGSVIKGTLTAYIIVERKDLGAEMTWDTGAIISLNSTLHSRGMSSENFVGDRLLLLHRYPDLAWDNKDPNVHVYGISSTIDLSDTPIAFSVWHSKAVWLSAAAIMVVEDSENTSEMAQALRRKEDNKSGG